jgi:hypothetical protein
MIDQKAYSASKRMSAETRLTRSYLRTTSFTRRNAAKMLEADIAAYLHTSGVRLPPEAVDGLQALVWESFVKGFQAGCRTGLNNH